MRTSFRGKADELMQIEAETQRDRFVAAAPRRTRRKILLVSLAALTLAGTAGGISSASAAWRGGGEEMGGGMPMRRMHRILDSVGATQGQREQIRAIWTGLRPQLHAERTQHKNLRQQMVAALTAPTINAGEVERLRKLSMASADKTSALITQGMVASAQVLTPDQRKQAQAELAKSRGHHRGEPHAD
jgi:Spy/CpxP family protein refolding chaperone